MERCNDVLELVEVSQQFKRIKFASNLGGAGEISLNSQIVDIVSEFDAALAKFHKSIEVCEIPDHILFYTVLTIHKTFYIDSHFLFTFEIHLPIY